ncbi:OLC1v1034538C1 [Oldenlandia corymbosa var. corymbosa]|uniref:OLC1v1034538C1 n=1 Tax=Oldenlandia corymbosa var. corymbosa TaxID=529605 RepID=A0AAV1CS52_OLDCO|nr:OLC1v1034538C1 [Oldenlandia corymbosa var. corymbosa]
MKNNMAVRVVLVGILFIMASCCLAAFPSHSWKKGDVYDPKGLIKNWKKGNINPQGIINDSKKGGVLRPEGIAKNWKKGDVNPESSVENHHNIPRQAYDQWGSGGAGGSSPGDDNGTSDDTTKN